MIETLFRFDRSNVQNCQSLYRGLDQREYYSGDFWIEDSGAIDVHSERKTVGPMAIIRQQSRSNLFFRRTSRHIREDATDLAILWYVKHGRLAITNNLGEHIVEPHDFAIMCSAAPFFIECQKDGTGRYEAMHITVPTHLLRRYIPTGLSTGVFMRMERSEIAIAERIFADIYADQGTLSDQSAKQFVEAALAAIGNVVRADAERQPIRQSISSKRMRDVERFIEVHLCDPHLSAGVVASGCGISRRYLSALLRRHGTSVPALIWDRRLHMAHDRLSATLPSEVSVSEIAYELGFKSPAHFSRKFKRFYKTNPSQLRGTAMPLTN